MSPQGFISKWGPGGPAYFLNEEQGAQSHFLDLCEVLGVPKPGTVSDYRFEERGAIIGGHSGYADVFMRNHFAWEEPLSQRFGRCVRQLRVEAARPDRIGERCGFYRTYLSRMDRGQAYPTLHAMEATANGLGLTIYELWDCVRTAAKQ
jgi:hypothetical protein